MRKRMLLLAFGCLLVLMVAGRLFFTNADFSPGNPLWNGISSLAFSRNVRPIYDIKGLQSMDPGDTLLIIGPSRNYSDDETAGVLAFLQGGGRVVVMDDFGDANSLLYGLSSPVTIDRVPLCQYEDFYVNQSCPIITVIPTSSYSSNATKLVLNHPAALKVNGSALIMASTSKYGWLDVNGDSYLNRNERMGSYPVIASSAYGQGELLVISDPDICINGMLAKGDNDEFMARIIRGSPWLDVSHGIEVVPLLRVYYALRSDPKLQAFTVLLILACGGLLIFRRPLIGRIKKLREGP